MNHFVYSPKNFRVLITLNFKVTQHANFKYHSSKDSNIDIAGDACVQGRVLCGEQKTERMRETHSVYARDMEQHGRRYVTQTSHQIWRLDVYQHKRISRRSRTPPAYPLCIPFLPFARSKHFAFRRRAAAASDTAEDNLDLRQTA